MDQYKTCTKCGQTKPITSFHKLKDKRKSQCADCIKANWHANKERMNSYCRKSYAKNKDKRLSAQKDYAQKNPEVVKATKAKYIANNPIKRKESMAKYRKTHADEILAKKRNYYGKNSDKWVRYASERGMRAKSDFVVNSKEIISLLRKPCVYCGSSQSREIDHIIPLSRGGEHRLGNLIGACRPCNRSKGGKFVMEWRLLQIKMQAIPL